MTISITMSELNAYIGPRCAACGAARGADQRHNHEVKGWKPRYDDFEGALEGYEIADYPPPVIDESDAR